MPEELEWPGFDWRDDALNADLPRQPPGMKSVRCTGYYNQGGDL